MFGVVLSSSLSLPKLDPTSVWKVTTLSNSISTISTGNHLFVVVVVAMESLDEDNTVLPAFGLPAILYHADQWRMDTCKISHRSTSGGLVR